MRTSLYPSNGVIWGRTPIRYIIHAATRDERLERSIFFAASSVLAIDHDHDQPRGTEDCVSTMALNPSKQFRESMHLRIHQRHKRRHNIFLTSVGIILFVAFILLLLVALSMPIIKPVYLLSLDSTTPDLEPTSLATQVRFGVWGYCATR